MCAVHQDLDSYVILPFGNRTYRERTVNKYPFVGMSLALMSGLLVIPPAYAVVSVVHVPEIDPSSALAGLTLLAGALAVMRGRRSKPQ